MSLPAYLRTFDAYRQRVSQDCRYAFVVLDGAVIVRRAADAHAEAADLLKPGPANWDGSPNSLDAWRQTIAQQILAAMPAEEPAPVAAPVVAPAPVAAPVVVAAPAAESMQAAEDRRHAAAKAGNDYEVRSAFRAWTKAARSQAGYREWNHEE